MRIKVIKARRRAVKLLGLCLSVVLVGAGAGTLVSKLRGAAPELQRPDILIAMGVCVAVWLGGASSEESSPEA